MNEPVSVTKSTDSTSPHAQQIGLGAIEKIELIAAAMLGCQRAADRIQFEQQFALLD
jgi:hypothetical protein